MFADRWQYELQLSYCQHCLSSARRVERLQYGAYLILDGRLGQVQLAADPLVRLSLHHQCEDLSLPFGETDVGRHALPLGSLRRDGLC